jgi:NAD(P)-dependent dehydrogenase (short-subunit alcohol dehydrogenase family)
MDTALITGGGGRIGRAVARRLIADGWRVLLADVDFEAARQAVTELSDVSSAEAVGLDITRLKDVKAAFGAASQRFGPIVGLVNAAGGETGADAGTFTDSDPETWRAIIDLHLLGVINCCNAVLPGMIAAGRGSIVSVAAIEGLRGDPERAVFSTAKAGVILLTEALVRECRPHGIRVNSIVPGSSRSLARTRSNDDAHGAAEATAFLLSDRAARTTGACLDVSDGVALH